MQRNLSTKAAFAVAIAIIVVAMSAVAAFAAPVLQPGVTSAPGMSGTCTDCHTYAKPASTPGGTTAAKPKPKPAGMMVSHPYITKSAHTAGVAFTVYGFFAPKTPKANQTSLALSAQQWNGHGNWVATSGPNATAVISAKGAFLRKMNYKGTMTIPTAGRYRLRATLAWIDAKGVEHVRRSSFLYVQIAH